jgi:RsiW-degrading membrane proteinase PrsW (M82 family)
VPLWWFIRYLDRYTSLPTTIAVAGFLWGGLAATWAFAQPANDALISLYGKEFGQAFAIDWAAALAAPITEELSKAAGFVLLLTLAPRIVRSPFDGLILGAFIGLGFQILEDVSYTWHAAQAQFGLDQGQAAAGIIGARTAVGLASHWLYSGIFCAGIVLLIGRPTYPPRRLLGIAFILAAMVSHGIWDSTTAIAAGSAVIGLVIPGAIVGELALFFVAYRITVRPEREWLQAVMEPEVQRGVITSRSSLLSAARASSGGTSSSRPLIARPAGMC